MLRQTCNSNSRPSSVLTLGGNDVFCVNDEKGYATYYVQPVGGTWEGDGVVDPTAGTFDTVSE